MKRLFAAIIFVLLVWETAWAGYTGPVDVTLPANSAGHVYTFCASGCDYSDPAAFEAARLDGVDLVAGGYSVVLQIKAGVYDVRFTPGDTATTDADHRIILMAYPGDECTGPTTGARIVWTAADAGEPVSIFAAGEVLNLGVSKPNGNSADSIGGIYIGTVAGSGPAAYGRVAGCYVWDVRNAGGQTVAVEVSTPVSVVEQTHVNNVSGATNVRCFGLADASTSTSLSNCEAYSATGADTTSGVTVDTCASAEVDACLFHDFASTGAAAIGIYTTNGSVVTASNNIIHALHGPGPLPNVGMGFELFATPGCSVLNNTVADCDVGYLVIGVTATATNNIAEDNGTNWIDTAAGGTWTKTTCTDDSGVTFVNAAGGDYHLAAAETAARNQGTSLAGTVDTDYDGNARPQDSVYDIGAFELVLPTIGLPCFQRVISFF